MSTKNNLSNALIMAGGTGGHIFPGIAVAQSLMETGWNVSWLGSQGGMEEQIVANAKIDIHLISISGLRGNGLVGWLKAPFSLMIAIYQAIKVIRKTQPNVIVGFGGFASGPGGVAALLTGTPLVIHEQNAIAGLTNKILATWAKKVFEGFPHAFKPSSKVATIGNPLRQDIERLNKNTPKRVTNNQIINVLIIGGSRGALALNKYLPKALASLINADKICVVHQVGKNRLVETQDFYRQQKIEISENLQLVEFIDDMAKSLAHADVLICRSGASTVAEVAATGVCAVFVPYPYAVDDHQTANAAWLVQQNAALSVSETELMSDSFKDKIIHLVESPESINDIAEQAKNVAYLNAALHVANYCEIYRANAA